MKDLNTLPPATKKLIEKLLPICSVTNGVETIAKDGKKYRYDTYRLIYNNAAYWLEKMFNKAAEENGKKEYNSQFSCNGILSVHCDKPTFKYQKTGKISFSHLVIL